MPTLVVIAYADETSAATAGEQAQRGAGVAAVEGVGGLVEAAQADAADVHVVLVAGDLDAEGADAGDRAEAVGAGEEVGDAGVALGDGVEDHGAVRDRLVARYGDGPAQAGRGGERDACHCSGVVISL